MHFSKKSLGIKEKVEIKEPVVVERIVEVPASLDEAEIINRLTEVIDAKLSSMNGVIEGALNKPSPKEESPEYIHTIVRDFQGLIVEIKSTPKHNRKD